MKNLLSKTALNIWRVRISVALIFMFFLAGVLFFFLPIAAFILAAVLVIAYIFAFFVYLPMLYKNCSYTVKGKTVYIQKGVLSRKTTGIELSKIQYCKITEGPLQRLGGVCSLRLLTAGSFETLNDISLLNARRIKNML